MYTFPLKYVIISFKKLEFEGNRILKERNKGIIYSIIAYTLWGIYPLYWRLLYNVRPLEILIARITWSFVTLFIIILTLKKMTSLKKEVHNLIKNKKRAFLMIVATFFIAINWFVFTFAVVTDRILHASFGYYINPILTILIGVIFLKEKLSKTSILAVSLAAIAVTFLAISYNELPWISIVLATSFALYGLVKKLIQLDAFFSLFLESILMMPVALIFTTFWLSDGSSVFLQGDITLILIIIGSGFITVSPLYFFSRGASIIPLNIMGFLQYIGPSLQIIIAILTGEQMSLYRMISFIVIWIACLIFSVGRFLDYKKQLAIGNVSKPFG